MRIIAATGMDFWTYFAIGWILGFGAGVVFAFLLF